MGIIQAMIQITTEILLAALLLQPMDQRGKARHTSLLTCKAQMRSKAEVNTRGYR